MGQAKSTGCFRDCTAAKGAGCLDAAGSEETSLAHLNSLALEEAAKQALAEEDETAQPSSFDATAALSQDAQVANSIQNGSPKDDSSKQVRIFLPGDEEELAARQDKIKNSKDMKASRSGSGSHGGESSYGLFSRGIAAGSAATYKFRRSLSLKAAIQRVTPHRAHERHQFWNTNFPQDYNWLEPPIWSIAKNLSRGMKCKDLSTLQDYMPLFFVCGACPNSFCGMQAVMYSASAADALDIDFWWVKPRKEDPQNIETETLCRHAKGPHKNDPGRSKQFYKPIADLFTQKSHMNALYFGVEEVPSPTTSGKAPRAYIYQDTAGATVKKHFLTLVWQEEWTQNPFARHKYIKGKIVYQRSPEDIEFFTKAYTIMDGRMMLSEIEDSGFPSPLPGEDVKYLDNAP